MAKANASTNALYYELVGSGAPVLLIQGVGVCGSGWKPQVLELSKDCQCLTFDNRGIGKSIVRGPGKLTINQMADDARDLMNKAGWESAHVVGHSLGGLVAQQMALDAPHRVRSLSLLCTFSKGPEGARVTPWVLWMTLRTRIGTRDMRRRAFLEMIFTDDYITTQGPGLASRVAPVIGRDLADQPAVLMDQVSAMRKHDISSRLHELSAIPTLVVSADGDPIARPEYGRRLSQLIKGSRYVEISKASHAVIIQEPEQINGLLRKHFVKSEEKRGADQGRAAFLQ